MTATAPSATASADSAARSPSARKPGPLTRWWRRRRAERRKIDFMVWDLRERYGQAAYGIAHVSSLQPIGFMQRKFWRKVAARLRRLE